MCAHNQMTSDMRNQLVPLLLELWYMLTDIYNCLHSIIAHLPAILSNTSSVFFSLSHCHKTLNIVQIWKGKKKTLHNTVLLNKNLTIILMDFGPTTSAKDWCWVIVKSVYVRARLRQLFRPGIFFQTVFVSNFSLVLVHFHPFIHSFIYLQ